MCDGTMCPCNLEEKPRARPDRDRNRKGALAAAAIFGPILLAGIVTILVGPQAGALVLLISWLLFLCAAAARAMRG